MADIKTKSPTFIRLKELYLKHAFLYNLIILSVLYFPQCFWGYMMYIAFPVLAILVIFSSLENGISYLIFSIPFCFLNIYMSTLLMLACAVIYIVKFYAIKYFKEKNKPNLTIILLMCIFFVYCVLPIGPYNLNKLIRTLLIGAIFLVLCMIIEKPKVFRGHFNIKLLCLSIIIASIFSLTYFFSPYLQDYMEVYLVSNKFIRFMALFYHTNVLAMFCEVLLALLAYFIVSKKGDKWDLILFAIIACIGLLTFSKTYFIILTFILISIFICCMCYNWKRTLIISAIVLTIAVVFCLIFPQPITALYNRLCGSLNDCHSFADIMNMVTTYRYNLWLEYINYIGTHPLTLVFGCGLGAPVLSTLSAHNAYISLIYEFGIIGAALFGTVLFFIFRRHFIAEHEKVHWGIFIPIVVIGLIFMVEDLIFYIFL